MEQTAGLDFPKRILYIERAFEIEMGTGFLII